MAKATVKYYNPQGKEISLDGLVDEMQRAVLEAARDNIAEQVGGMVCKQHGQGVEISITIKPDGSHGFGFAGCCQSFVDAVVQRIGD